MKLAGCYCTSWTETAGTRDPAIRVDFIRHYEFSDGERLTSESSRRFCTESTMRKSLQRICFEIVCLRIVAGPLVSPSEWASGR